MQLKIGELAKRSGVTVRTLHHYDSIGLLTPSGRSDAAYRLYNRNDVIRLHRIQALRRLNLSLSEIAALIDRETMSLDEVLQDQVSQLELQIRQSSSLLHRLQALQELIKANQELTLDDWLGTLEMMNVADKYFHPHELAWQKDQYRLQKSTVDIAMRPLVIATRQLMQAQIPPTAPEATELAVRWISTMEDVLPDEPYYLTHMTEMLRNEPGIQMLYGVDQELMDYVSRAAIAVRYNAYRKYLSEHELRFFSESQFRHANDWARLFSDVRDLHRRGYTPVSPEAQALLKTWRAMFADSWGNDAGVLLKVREAHMKEPDVFMGGSGLARELMAYAREGLIWLEQQIRLGRQ